MLEEKKVEAKVGEANTQANNPNRESSVQMISNVEEQNGHQQNGQSNQRSKLEAATGNKNSSNQQMQPQELKEVAGAQVQLQPMKNVQSMTSNQPINPQRPENKDQNNQLQTQSIYDNLDPEKEIEWIPSQYREDFIR